MLKNDNLNQYDIEVIKFLSKYKMLKVENTKYIYKTKRYYRQRINRLIENQYVKRYKNYIMLDKNGRKVVSEAKRSYIKNMENKAYMDRLKHISDIAAMTIDSNLEFIPSWNLKEKDKFTDTARRYIGKLKINGTYYLTYYLSYKKEHVYIKQMIFDIRKALDNENILIFVDDYNNICKKYSYLAFGKNKTIIIINNEYNKKLLKNYDKLNIHDLLEIIYEEELFISDWELADFLKENGEYIIFMLFIDTETLSKLNWYFIENSNSNRKVEIITLPENIEKIKERINIKNCKIKTFDKNLLGGICENQSI